ncbi:MAG: hypothetical protein C4550_06985 [Nitrospiraceae bacterium]|nr:MAG: hypothetical protein C4550_06985 [Nitrospiraceae bacterium]
MNDFSVRKEVAKEKILQEMLEYAGVCHTENIINEIEKEERLGEQIPFPSELDRRINKLIANYNRKSKIEKAWKGATAVFSKVARLFS